MKTYIDGRPVAEKSMLAHDHGVILQHGDQWDCYGARDAWVFAHNGKLYMHYDAAGPQGWLAALAVSDDGISWTKHGPVLELGEAGSDDSASASYGTTYYDGQQWHMFYLGTPNCTPFPDCVPAFPYTTCKAQARSPLGPWQKQRDVLPFRPEPGTYTAVTASPGQIVARPDGYRMFFSAATDNASICDVSHLGTGQVIKRTLGIARTQDLNSSWQLDPVPILPLDEQIENASLYYEPACATWFLFTNHVGVSVREDMAEQPPVEYTDAIWVYWSADLDHWNPANKAIVLDGTGCSWSHTVIGLPSVVPVGKRLAIFYDGLVESGITHMRRDIGLAWLDLPLRIPEER